MFFQTKSFLQKKKMKILFGGIITLIHHYICCGWKSTEVDEDE